MIANYLTVILRNISKYKIFSLINLAGMAISLTSALLIALFIESELAYDKYYPAANRTYRIYNEVSRAGGGMLKIVMVPFPFATVMKRDFPEVESTLRLMDTYGERLFKKGSIEALEGNGLYAETTAFDILSLHVLGGNPKTALLEPKSVALSEGLAQKYFHTNNVVGQTISINSEDWKITSVFADLPEHSHLQFSYLLSLASTGWPTTHQDNWVQQQVYTYIRFHNSSDAGRFKAKLKPFVEKYAYPQLVPKGLTYIPYLQKISDIHLHSSDFEYEIAKRGNAQAVYILAATGFIILIIACLNFINLSTARSIKRMKEVGIRKVVGAQRGQLITQFLMESLVFVMASIVIAVLLSALTLPFLNGFTGKHLSIPITMQSIGIAVGFGTLLAFVAGYYPGLKLSSFRPARVLYGKNEGDSTAFLRQSLVVIQFMFSFFLVIGSGIILSQNNLLHNQGMGFNKDQIVVIPLTVRQLAHAQSTKLQYLNNPGVVSATIGYGLPGDIFAGDDITNPVEGVTYPATVFCVDEDYLKTMEMTLVTGRNFSPDIPADSSNAFILNESAARSYGLGTPEEAIGKRLEWERWDDRTLKKGTVIGVVRDFNIRSLREKVSPVVLHIYPKAAWKMAVRIRPENIDGTIAHLRKTYTMLEPSWVFTYSFLDQNFESMYASEKNLGVLFTIFTILAIIVACLGLYGLVEFSVNQRLKEIGIRKVFGASVGNILLQLTSRYFRLLLVAFILIVPVAMFAASHWLENFAYRIPLSPWLFIKAGLIITTVTIFTVAMRSVAAAVTNPSVVLRND